MSSRARCLASGASALALAWTLASGCADESAPPETVVPDDAGVDGAPDAAQGGAAPKRTVEVRHPFGNVAAVDNLLWDGDFEWVYPYADQHSWMVGGSEYLTGFLGGDDLVYGAPCRSGIKCAEVRGGRMLVGMGVASRGHSLSASVWARPSAGDCAAIEVTLLSARSNEFSVQLPPASQQPDGSGYCHYAAIASERKSAIMLLIENVGDEPAIIDDAVVEPVDPAELHYGAAQPSAERLEVLDRLREQVREARKPQVPPPNPSRLLLQRKLGRLAARRGVQH